MNWFILKQLVKTLEIFIVIILESIATELKEKMQLLERLQTDIFWM